MSAPLLSWAKRAPRLIEPASPPPALSRSAGGGGGPGGGGAPPPLGAVEAPDAVATGPCGGCKTIIIYPYNYKKKEKNSVAKSTTVITKKTEIRPQLTVLLQTSPVV